MATMNGACEHKQLLRCEMTAVPVCCMCADGRPMSQAYPTYVDGSGMRNEGTRWQKYCWRCRDHWRAQEQLDQARRVSANQETWSFSSQPSTNTALSPFSGTQRRRERSLSSLLQIPLQSTDSSETTRHSHWSADIPHNQSSTREDDNYADHISPPEPRRRPPQNPFGTREEWEAADYQSPITGMFTRAWTRYRDAEADRRRTEAEIQDQMQRLLSDPNTSSQAPDTSQERTQWSDTASHTYFGGSTGPLSEQSARTRRTIEQLRHTTLPRSDPPRDFYGHPNFPDPASRLFYPDAHLTRDRGYIDVTNHSRSPSPTQCENPIDTQPARPAPMSSEDMTVNIACKICCEQKTDTVLLPCYHVAICRWCAGIMRKDAQEERARRRRGHGHEGLTPRVRGEGWQCPICRRAVEGMKRIYLG